MLSRALRRTTLRVAPRHLARLRMAAIPNRAAAAAVTTLNAAPVSAGASAAASAAASSALGGVRGLQNKRGAIPSSFDPNRDAKSQDKLLYTPGPLTTSYSVKKAMMRDLGSRDGAFIAVIKEVCEGLLEVAGVAKDKFTTIPMQGSGTFGIEAVLSSVINKKKGDAVLVISNGAYGVRQKDIVTAHGIAYEFLECPEDERPSLEAIENVLKTSKKNITHVSVIHSETTSGIINDVEAIGQLAHKYGKSLIVDAMSSFGAVPVDFEKGHIDFLISSSNKCIEGVPGFSFILARNSALAATKGNADTVSLDIHRQSDGFKKNAQFRFTPPTHAMLAFGQALTELRMEGGVSARQARYQENQKVLKEAMIKLGFVPYLKDDGRQGWIITSYRYPTDKGWNFEAFYSKLNDLGFVIYPGKVSNADCFRIGHIGRITPDDTRRLCKALEVVCKEMKTARFAEKKAKL